MNMQRENNRDVNSMCWNIKKYHTANMVQTVNDTWPPQNHLINEIVSRCFSHYKLILGDVLVHFQNLDYNERWKEALFKRLWF